MIRIWYGQDEFRFDEEHRAIAQNLAASLPQLRALALQVAGATGPPSLRVIVTSGPLWSRDCRRWSWQLWFALLLFSLLTLVGVLTHVWALALVSGIFTVAVLSLPSMSQWPRADAIHTGIPRRAYLPTIALRWPPHPRGTCLAPLLVLPEEELERALVTFAHAYGHCLLRTIRRTDRIPAWLDEGFASLFAEWALGRGVWTVGSQDCKSEPEAPQGKCRLLRPQSVRGTRTAARYHWEVRALAEQGRLREALSTSSRRLAAMRPKPQPEEQSTLFSGRYASISKLACLSAGPDEILYQPEYEEMARHVAAILPEARARGKEITGSPGPASVCVTVSADPPPLSFLRRTPRGRSVPRGRFPVTRGTLTAFVLIPLAILLSLWRRPIPVTAMVAVLLYYLLLLRLAASASRRIVCERWPMRGTLTLAGAKRSLIMVCWPWPPASCRTDHAHYDVPEETALQRAVAAGYAYSLLSSLDRKEAPPAWFEIGFGQWFADRVVPQPFWRPESHHWLEGPEPSDGAEVLRDMDSELYLPRLARAYWQVRALAEQGKLESVLRASTSELEQFRTEAVAAPRAVEGNNEPERTSPA